MLVAKALNHPPNRGSSRLDLTRFSGRLPAITAKRLAIIALPVKLAGLDGAPARVLAIEGFDLPREFEVST